MDRRRAMVGIAAALAAGSRKPAAAQGQVEISFAFPVAVGGSIMRIIDTFVAAFSQEHPSIKVTPVYAGNYQEALASVMAAHRRGKPPTLSVLLSTDMFSLIDEEVIIPFDTLVDGSDDQAWLNGFFPAFMLNSRSELRTWGIPFQRSTMVLFWNRDLFEAAGLDPTRAPVSWTEHVVVAEKLTKRGASGSIVQWGTQIPTTAFAYWSLQALSLQCGARLANLDGNRTAFDDPGAVEALTYLVDLSKSFQVMAPGRIEWSTTPRDFLERKTAMIWTTTGNLAYLRDNARFPFGVAVLPANRRRGAPTGGGNFYLSRKSLPAEQEAAATFVRWITRPERAAQWSIATGYVAVSPAAYETAAMVGHLRQFPEAAIARDQLGNAGPELSTHENQRVTRILEDGISAALIGAKTPSQALKDAQAEAERILRRYR